MSQSHRALVVGVSTYPKGLSTLPAVAADVREIAKLLGSEAGAFDPAAVEVLTEAKATKASIISSLQDLFGQAAPGDTIFAYLAGHGMALSNGSYYFLPSDVRLNELETSAVPLDLIKRLFEQSASERVLLWLDFCHSGGILARGATSPDIEGAAATIARSLRVVEGRGKVIMCACTADQSAYEDNSHGRFTRFLLKGLQGNAANAGGEVTANSLHDYIDHQMGSAQQRPMFFGTMTGRIVMMHSRGVKALPPSPAPVAAPLVISDSGDWVMLGGVFFKSSSVTQSEDNEILVEIPSEGAEDDALIRGLAPEPWARKPIQFAHRNDGIIARVQRVSSRSAAGQQIWKVVLAPEAIQYGGGAMTDVGLRENDRAYSGDEIAELRARRLLLNDPPAIDERKARRAGSTGMLEIMIQGMNNPYPADHCVFRMFYPQLRGDERKFLELSRLAAIFALKSSQVFEYVTELKLGPITNGRLEVFCRGKRRRVYTNKPATEFTIQGSCPLE